MKPEDSWERVYRSLDVGSALPSSVFATGQPQAQQFLSLLPEGAEVLDYGCGMGRNTIPLLQRRLNVTVSDISQTAMNSCMEITGRLGFSPRAIPLADGKLTCEDLFDGILVWSVLDHMTLTQATETTQALARSAKPGGLLLASFDGPEEISEAVTHLPDGSVQIMAGKRAGMVLRVFSEEEVKSLFSGWELICYSGGPDQRKVILCRWLSTANGRQ